MDELEAIKSYCKYLKATQKNKNGETPKNITREIEILSDLNVPMNSLEAHNRATGYLLFLYSKNDIDYKTYCKAWSIIESCFGRSDHSKLKEINQNRIRKGLEPIVFKPKGKRKPKKKTAKDYVKSATFRIKKKGERINGSK